MMRKRLMMLLMLLAALGLLLAWRAGTAQEETRFRVYLPLMEKAYEEALLPPPVAWKVTRLPSPPGYVTSLAATPDGALFAVSLGEEGLRAYRSLDGGGSWLPLDDAVLGREVRAYRLYRSPAYDQDRALFALGFSGLARSTDGGSSWHTVGSNLPLKQMVALAFSPGYAADGAIYALSALAGDLGPHLYRSRDRGESWELLSDLAEMREGGLVPNDLAALSPTGLAIATSRGILRTEDGGSSWHTVGSNLPVKQMVALAFSPGYAADGAIYALSAPAGDLGPHLYRSRDRGESWELLSDLVEMREGGLVPNDLAAFGPSGLAIATSRGMLRTEDGGATWQREEAAFAEPGTEPAIRAVARLASGELLALSSGRRIPYKSSDGGRTWRWTGHGMEEGGPYRGGLALAVSPGRVFLAATGAQGASPGLFHSPDGDSWRPIEPWLEQGSGISALFALSDDVLLLAAGEQGIWKVEALP